MIANDDLHMVVRPGRPSAFSREKSMEISVIEEARRLALRIFRLVTTQTWASIWAAERRLVQFAELSLRPQIRRIEIEDCTRDSHSAPRVIAASIQYCIRGVLFLGRSDWCPADM